MTETASNGNGVTQLPVARLKENTVIRVADDIGIPSQEIVCLVVCTTEVRFIATAPKDIIVQGHPEKDAYVQYQPSRKTPDDIIQHVVTEINQSIKEKRPYLSIYFTPNPVRVCETDPVTGHREAFLSKPKRKRR